MWLLAPFVLLVLAPNVAWLHRIAQGPDFSPLPFAAGLVCVLTVLALGRRLWLGVALLSPFALLAPFEVLYIVSYDRPSDAHLLGILGETNVDEVRDFVTGVGLGMVGLALAVLAFSALVISRAARVGWCWRGRTRVWVLAGGVLAGALFAAMEASVMPAEAGIDDPLNNPDEMVMAGDSSFAAQQLTDAYPVGVPFRIAAYMQQREGLGQALETLKDYRFGVVHMAGVQGREVHVLVIGETGRPDRWQLNGYARPTTPRLVATENVVSFSNVISAWAWTRMSVPLILTRKPAVDKRAFFPEKSLIGAFREAGFRTYWFSTQSPLGVHDSSIAMHAREADETRFLNPVGYKGEGAHDEALLAPLRQVLARNESRQLIVLHTLGSHYNYADRYPEAFDVFRPSLKGRKDASLHDRSQALAMSNSYDNSVLYTDHLLAEVIDRVRATSARATLLYVADHGENLFDGRCDKSGHGHATERDFRVASIWWSSDAYASANPEKAALLRQRRDAPATTGHVFHTLLDLANIRYPGENRTRSLASPQWAPHPRWTQAGVDFDEARREPICKTLMRAPTRY